MLLANIFLCFTSVIACILGLFVIVSNPKKTDNRVLALIVFSIFTWLATNLLTNLSADPQVSLFFARMTLVGPMLFSYFFFIFSQVFLSAKAYDFKIALLNGLPVVFVFLFLGTDYNIASIGAYGEDTKVGPLYVVAAAIAFVLIARGVVTLVQKYRRTSSAIERNQIKYIFFGIFAAFLPSLVTNAVLPIFGNYSTFLYGPNSVILLAIFMTIAIVKHHLLDIKLIVARTLGYVLTLGTLVGIYIVGIFGFSASLFGTGELSGLQQFLYIIATLVFGFSLAPLKRFFDRQTNKLFYRDSYDTQVLFDELNKVLVGNIDLKPMLTQCSKLFEDTLKAEYCTFIINETDDSAARTFASSDKHLDEQGLIGIDNKYYSQQKIMIADELPEVQTKVKTLLRDNDVSVLARMVPTAKRSKELGILVLGNKRSGNPYNKQDLQVLEIIVNELVVAIQSALRFEEIQAFTVTLQEKVDAATKNLRAANEKLKALDETKDEFISMASHQLRTPLTSVKGYVSMVVEGDAGKITKQQKDLLTQAFTSSQRMVYLIADLLNVSRLRTGKFVIENKPTQLADVIEAEMAQLKETAKGKNQELTYEKPSNFPIMNLDETKIRQVIMNFTDNALHYTPNDGHIKVKLEDKGNSIEFTVVDDGLGVPKNEQHHLFGKFYRAGNAKKARPDGTGLGLFMAKKVVIAQGGAIIFKSEENKGSTFGFTMPKQGHIISK